MTEEQIALGRRAVACRKFRWLPGMLGWRLNNHAVPHSIRFVEGVETMGALAGVGKGRHIPSGYATCDGDWRAEDITPDLTDPATLGCLLALVREALNSPRVHVLYVAGLYRWECADNRTVHGVGATEAEALIETLEYAP